MTEPITLSLMVPSDHPSFPGHFPTQPILPGAVLLDLTISALGQALDSACGNVPGVISVASAKFLKPVGPNSRLWVLAERTVGGRWRCTIRHTDGSKVALCELEWRGVA